MCTGTCIVVADEASTKRPLGGARGSRMNVAQNAKDGHTIYINDYKSGEVLREATTVEIRRYLDLDGGAPHTGAVEGEAIAADLEGTVWLS